MVKVSNLGLVGHVTSLYEIPSIPFLSSLFALHPFFLALRLGFNSLFESKRSIPQLSLKELQYSSFFFIHLNWTGF
ncbi:hypothetical protein WN943_029518 [Citrus x changshan-huyou]